MTKTQHKGEHITGVKDKNYNLVSSLYHLLQAATNYDTYIQDAEKDGDKEAAQFFRTAARADRQAFSRGRKAVSRAVE